MKLRNYIINKYDSNIETNKDLNEKTLKLSSLKDFPLKKCKQLSIGGNGFNIL